MIRETVGKVSSDLIVKPLETTSPYEQMQEQLANYDREILDCIARSKIDFPGDFYIVVLTKRERLMQNVFRSIFFGRLSCPTPDWDQSVYKYNRKNDDITFLWVIPSKQTCEEMTMNKHLIPPDEYRLLEYVLSFNDGTLKKKAKEMNGEKEESVELKGFIYKG
jgi:hypothetical protein